MVLMAIVGELGAGKTLAMCYLAWRNWIKKGRRIFSNLTLYGFPFTRVSSIPDLDKMKSGFFVGDELWLSISSWGQSKVKEFITSILLKSRKRDITIVYTTQSFHQVNKRIRDVTDFICYPIMSVDNSYCRLEIFRGPTPSIATRMNPPIYFNTEPIFAIYNTYEEVKPFDEEKSKFKEEFHHIWENPAWIRYLREKGLSEKQIMKESIELEKIINPEGITSESQRKVKEDFMPI